MSIKNVVDLLKASSNYPEAARSLADACKYFFLLNYIDCTELESCESLDPKLLCTLMRLHNSLNVPQNVYSNNVTSPRQSTSLFVADTSESVATNIGSY